MNAYKYTELLGRDSIRLMTLQPGRNGDDLYCSLSEVPLPEAPKYEALSYVWGDATMAEFICCDGSSLYITDTLKIALQRLRLPNSPRLLWIDQICIDQNDNDERGHQVKLMASIYSMAKEVIIWLGDASYIEAAPAFSLISKILAKMQTKIIPYVTSEANNATSSKFPTNEVMAGLELPPRDSPEWDALEQLTKQPYFTRIWVIQESRAAKSAKMRWGGFEVDWFIFWSMVFILARFGCMQTFEADDPKPGLDLNDILALTPNPALRTPDSLLYLLWTTQHRKATDPRDRVFALLGLPTDLSSHELSFEADYHKSTIEVYRDLARFSILNLQSLDVLSYVCHADSSLASDSPSWCPRWDRNAFWGRPLSQLGSKACAGKRAILRERDQSQHTLSIQGVEVTSVEWVSQLGNESVLDLSLHSAIHNCWEKVSQKLPGHYNGKPLIQSFVSTLTAGITVDPQNLTHTPVKNEHLFDFVAYFSGSLVRILGNPDILSNHKSCPRHNLNSAILALELARHLGEEPKPIEVPAKLQGIFKVVLRTIHPRNEAAAAEAFLVLMSLLAGGGVSNRFLTALHWGGIGTENFFLTKSGLMGIGPRAMETGDIVAVLYGGQTPYILRPVAADHFLFVGACYVEGIMSGEAINMVEGGKLEAESFTLY
ncbi:heterokaryon incompatibility protein-domain-containing protein [Tricladium varicosporioides]|nr:heterokaryon incompatibility protein-domain-containing protein [Hymenoscyphus varicosporioides]